MLKHTLPNTNFCYFTKNTEKPRLLIHAGTHGNESQSIEYVTAVVAKYEHLLPPFIYVSHVSPSAVAQKTRLNANGIDVNRMFYDNSKDQEIMWNQQILKKGPFDLAVSFHEDLEYSTYYIYDEGPNDQESVEIKLHNAWLEKQGISLLNGVDDSMDADLGYTFAEGYKRINHHDKNFVPSGEMFDWVIKNQLAKQGLTPEIPGNSDQKTKVLMIDSFFTQVVIPKFSS